MSTVDVNMSFEMATLRSLTVTGIISAYFRCSGMRFCNNKLIVRRARDCLSCSVAKAACLGLSNRLSIRYSCVLERWMDRSGQKAPNRASHLPIVFGCVY